MNMEMTRAEKIIIDAQELVNTSPNGVNAQRLADRYLELTAIVKEYVEGKISAKEVNAAQTARDGLNKFFVTTKPMIGDRHAVLEWVKLTLAVEMCDILTISETRFGTKQGMVNILANQYLRRQFSDKELVEIKKIADGFSFFAHKRLVSFMQTIRTKYSSP